MLKEIFKIDNDGYVIDKFVADNENIEIVQNIIEIDIPQGLYRPKWSGTEWVSTMTEVEYIESLNNPPIEPTENELLMLAIADLDFQRETDKLETQLAIAELAETLLGGVI